MLEHFMFIAFLLVFEASFENCQKNNSKLFCILITFNNLLKAYFLKREYILQAKHTLHKL